MRKFTQFIVILSVILIANTMYARDFEHLRADDDGIIFSQVTPHIGTNISFKQEGSAYDAYYSDKDTGWQWRSSPHWKIFNSNGFMKFDFKGQRAFVFTALGSESGGRSQCTIEITVNGKVIENAYFLGSSWRRYVIPADTFNEKENSVILTQLPGTSMWISEVHLETYDPFDGVHILTPKVQHRDLLSFDELENGTTEHIDSQHEISSTRGSIELDKHSIFLYQASLKLPLLESARDWQMEFTLLCDTPDDFKIGFGKGQLLRFTKSRTTLVKWMGSNFSAPAMDLSRDNTESFYRVLYKNGRLKLYVDKLEVLNVEIEIDPDDIHLLTGGKMKAELQNFKITYTH